MLLRLIILRLDNILLDIIIDQSLTWSPHLRNKLTILKRSTSSSPFSPNHQPNKVTNQATNIQTLF